MDRKEVTPLLIELEGISPDTAPYLVSAAKEPWLWIEEAHPENSLKAAVRPMTSPGEVFMGVVREISRRGQADQWENGFEFSQEGVKAALERAKYYDLPEPELLIARLKDDSHHDSPKTRPEWLNPKTFGCSIRFCSWLPGDLAVVVSKDRGFLGTLGYVAKGHHWVAVHNASRGLAFAGDPLK